MSSLIERHQERIAGVVSCFDRVLVRGTHYVPDLAPLGRYHWSIAQAEYATDIVFHSTADLAPLYGHLLRASIHAVKADDIATFLGRAPNHPGDRQIGGDFSIRIHVRYDFIREGGRWVIDDISSTADGKPWTLRRLLKSP